MMGVVMTREEAEERISKILKQLELDQLCKKHDVTVTSSMYDKPAVWDGYDVVISSLY